MTKLVDCPRERPPALELECPMTWESLAATEDEGVRFCGECSSRVYACFSVEEEQRHATEGHCIARLYTEYLVLGRPHGAGTEIGDVSEKRRKPRWKKSK